MTIAETLLTEDLMQKRIQIYTEALQDDIALIMDELRHSSEKLQEIARRMRLPYPLFTMDEFTERYHISPLTLLTMSCIQKLHDEIQSAPTTLLEECANEYLAIIADQRGLPGHAQTGTNDVWFDDQLREQAEHIAYGLEGKGIEIPYLFRVGDPSYKIIACVSILYTAKMLQISAKQEPEASNNDSN